MHEKGKNTKKGEKDKKKGLTKGERSGIIIERLRERRKKIPQNKGFVDRKKSE